MNEKLQYASMLEMPFSTANVTVMPQKKKKKKVNPETVKQELIQKVNAEEAVSNYSESILPSEYNQAETASDGILDNQDYSANISISLPTEKKKGRFKNFKISVVAVQFALIGALIATIFLTNAINPNSGINTFFKGVFTSEPSKVVDQRLHSEFAPVIAMDEGEYVLDNGVMTLSASGSIYSPCDGVISTLSIDGNGKYIVEIEHSTNFKSRLTGLDFVYGEEGAAIYSNVPVGYMANEGATLCFTGADGSVISGYQIVDNSVVWAV